MKSTEDFAQLCEKFFTTWLIEQRRLSQNTIESYAHCFRLFIGFASRELRESPEKIGLSQIDAALVVAFLEYLEKKRGNCTASRNARRAAIASFFRFCALEAPQYSARIQRILAIPIIKVVGRSVSYLTRVELEALLSAIDQSRWVGRRNFAIICMGSQTGLRSSELRTLRHGDIEFGRCAYVRCVGKGRKERITPIAKAVASVLKTWIAEQGGGPEQILFPSRNGTQLSSDAIQYAIKRSAAVAAIKCPSLAEKRVHPHVLRHTAAMHLMEAGVDMATIAAWLGHESMDTTRVYAVTTLAMKQRALEKSVATKGKMKRFAPDGALLKFLNGLGHG